jgi:hypothetical protein
VEALAQRGVVATNVIGHTDPEAFARVVQIATDGRLSCLWGCCGRGLGLRRALDSPGASAGMASQSSRLDTILESAQNPSSWASFRFQLLREVPSLHPQTMKREGETSQRSWLWSGVPASR